jgi:ribosome modulation factor
MGGEMDKDEDFIKQKREAYNAGYKSRVRQRPKTDNPYTQLMGRMWIDGWNQADVIESTFEKKKDEKQNR